MFIKFKNIIRGYLNMTVNILLFSFKSRSKTYLATDSWTFLDTITQKNRNTKVPVYELISERVIKGTKVIAVIKRM